MAGPEATIERECRAHAQGLQCRLEKIRFSNRRGCPDRLLLVPRGDPPGSAPPFVAFVEFKGPRGSLSPMQEVVNRELRQTGVEVWVIDDVNEFKHRLEVVRADES